MSTTPVPPLPTAPLSTPLPTYSKIRFIGYPITTTPGNLINIWPGTVAGTYLADPDIQKDIQGRIQLLQLAVETARGALPAPGPASGEDQILNVFLGPEFFFHGVLGPYVFSPQDALEALEPPAVERAQADASPLSAAPVDPMDEIQNQLKNAFKGDEYRNWIFVFGTGITAQVRDVAKEYLSSFGTMRAMLENMLQNFIRACHGIPIVQVRDRAPIHGNVGFTLPNRPARVNEMTTEKYSVSFEDLVLYDPNAGAVTKVITEQMIAYPAIDLSNGDLKRKPEDMHAIFRQEYLSDDGQPVYVDMGIEICLDHLSYRLRKGIGRQPFPKVRDGIHVQLIPSCGASIVPAAVAVDGNGWVFNCDGQAAIGSSSNFGKCVLGTPNDNYSEMNCLYTDNSAGSGHTQLARVVTPAVGGNPSLGTDATFCSNLPPATAKTIPVTVPSSSGLDVGRMFSSGPGEVHIYGLTEPYPIFGSFPGPTPPPAGSQ